MKKQCIYCGQASEVNFLFCPLCGEEAEIDFAQIVNNGLCPSCGSVKLKVVSTPRPYRYIRCHRCGGSFKSMEVFVEHPRCFEIAAIVNDDFKNFK